jgi:hypothetical protein
MLSPRSGRKPGAAPAEFLALGHWGEEVVNDGEMMENHDGEHDFLTFLMNLWYL